MFQTLDNLEGELHRLVTALDPHALTPVDAADAVHAFAVIARIATAGLTRLAHRAGECTRWRQRDFPDIGAWLADELGSTVADGRRLYDASTRPDLCPDTWRLMSAGVIAPLAAAEIIASAIATEKARALAAAAAEAERRRQEEEQARRADPPDDGSHADDGDDVRVEAMAPAPPAELGKTVDEVEHELLDLAQDRTGTIRRLREERDKAEAAARDEAQAAIHAFLNRAVTFGSGHDGMGHAHVHLSNELMAVVRSILDARANKLFRAGGRGANGRAPTNANLLADALVLLLTGRLPAHPDGANAPSTGATRRAPTPRAPTSDRPGGGVTDPTSPPAAPGCGSPPAQGSSEPRAPGEAGPDRAHARKPRCADGGTNVDDDVTHASPGADPRRDGPLDPALDQSRDAPSAPADNALPDDAHGRTGDETGPSSDLEAAAPAPDADDDLVLDLGLDEDHPGGASEHDTSSASPAPLVGPTGEIVVRVDAFALARGTRLPGEACEIVGAGPISVAEARRLAAHACIDVVIRDANGVTTVACTGRRLARRLDLGPPPPPPRHRTRLILLMDARRIRGPGDQLHLPGTGAVSRALLLRALPAAAIETIAACAVDPDVIDTDGRSYPRPLAVAVREANPHCHRCGFDRWLQYDHVLALAFGGRTKRANLARPCVWCHAKKSQAEARAAVRAGRRRAQQRRAPESDTTGRSKRRRRRRTPTPADDP